MLRVLPVVLLAILLAAFGGVGSAVAQGAVGAIVGPGESIQKAVNAADPGDTIIVGPGTYNESIIINKDVTVISLDGAGTTFIVR